MLIVFIIMYYLLLPFYFADVLQINVLQNTVATLPCPHAEGDISWTHLSNSKHVTLVSIKNGIKNTLHQRYDLLANKSLVIRNVEPSDERMYFCNQRKTAYLKVTTDPNMVPVTPRNDGLGFGLGPGQKGDAADSENQQPSDFWKVPVGVVVGAALALLVVLTLRLCSKLKTQTNSNLDKTETEVIYEEIEAGEEKPRRGSEVESPYYWTSISDAPSSSTPPNNNLYSQVNKLRTKGRSSGECVYYLAQNPAQTGVSCQYKC